MKRQDIIRFFWKSYLLLRRQQRRHHSRGQPQDTGGRWRHPDNKQQRLLRNYYAILKYIYKGRLSSFIFLIQQGALN